MSEQQERRQDGPLKVASALLAVGAGFLLLFLGWLAGRAGLPPCG